MKTTSLTLPFVLTLLAGLAQGQNTERVDVSTSNAIAATGSGGAHVTTEGRFCIFVSSAANLVPGDTNGVSDVFVRDRELNTLTRISVPDPSMPATQGNGGVSLCRGSAHCASRDGRFVVFTSDADNLVPGDTNGVSDVFVRDRDLDGNGIMDEPGIGKTSTRRVNLSTTDTQATGSCPQGTCTHYSYDGTISNDGRFVAFVSGAALTPGAPAYTNIYLRDRDADGDGIFDEVGGSPEAATTVLVSKRICCSGDQFDGFSDQPAISANGRFVAFVSKSDHIVFGDTNGYSDIFVYDRITSTIAQMSLSTTGDDGGAGDCSSPSITDDGSEVVFATARSGLVAGDTQYSDIFLRRRDTDHNGIFDEAGGVSTELISLGRSAFPLPNGSEVKLNGDSDSPSIDSNGIYIAFASTATNHTASLAAADSNNAKDVLVRNMVLDVTVRASVTLSGEEANGASGSPSIDWSGYFTGFSSTATNLQGADSNGAVADAYVRSNVFRSVDYCPVINFTPGPIGFNTYGAYADGQSSCGNSNNSPDYVFAFVASCTGMVNLNTEGSTFDTVLSIHTACPTTLDNELACDDDGGAGTTSSINLHTTQGVRYFVRVSGYNMDSGYGTLYFGFCVPDPCPADFNQDGGIDGSDVSAFFAAWEAGDSAGDVNYDGGIDGADVSEFFRVWEAGGC